MALNEKQQLAFDLCTAGENVFLTGNAGTGKSHVLKAVCAHFDEKKHKYAVTAMTGSAAVLIEGTTLHRWAGIGKGSLSAELLVKDILRRPQKRPALNNWRATQTLIIDEISMMDAALLEKLDTIGRELRESHSNAPFGGLQVILCGDFAQLPPVRPKGGMCFESKIWSTAIQKRIELTDIIRQSDGDFQRALSEIRMGIVTSETAKLLRSRVGVKVDKGPIKPTVLFCKRVDTTSYNEKQLETLESPITMTYRAFDRVDPKVMAAGHAELTRLKETIGEEMQAREELRLKLGSQVMLIYNKDNVLVNGSRGIVVDFGPTNAFNVRYPIVQFTNGQRILIDRHDWRVGMGDGRWFVRSQVPLILSWANTIHKCQGSTLDCVKIDISDCFDYGQAYVALSRVKHLEGLSLSNKDLSRIMVHPKVKEFYGQS